MATGYYIGMSTFTLCLACLNFIIRVLYMLCCDEQVEIVEHNFYLTIEVNSGISAGTYM